MSLRTVGERPRHNPYQLCCSFANCRRWFRNQSGLTNHLCSGHPRQVALPQAQYQCSPPSANADEAQNTRPIHRYNESSSQGDQYSTPPLARSQFSPPLPDFGGNAGSSIQLQHQDGSSPPVHSPQESLSELPIPKGDEPIMKVFHPIINGLYIPLA